METPDDRVRELNAENAALERALAYATANRKYDHVRYEQVCLMLLAADVTHSGLHSVPYPRVGRAMELASEFIRSMDHAALVRVESTQSSPEDGEGAE